MDKAIEKVEQFMELGGTRKEIVLLVISGISLVISIFDLVPLPFDAAWVAIILCGVPIIIEAIIGLITAFDIKADVLVSMALVAAVCIGDGSEGQSRHREAGTPDSSDCQSDEERDGRGSAC